ncbi:unnamed protein product [Prunus armeniaca]
MQAWPPLAIEGKFASQHGSKSKDQMCLILCSIFLAKKIQLKKKKMGFQECDKEEKWLQMASKA